MKIALALGLNIGLLLLLVQWIRQQQKLPLGKWLLPLLGIKGLVSTHHYFLLNGDARYFQNWAEVLTRQFWALPGSWVQTLFSDELHYGQWELVFHGFSNTFFMIKLLSVLNLGSMGAVLLNSAYLALFSFVGCWQLVRAMGIVFPETPRGAAVVAFLAWPTVLYWTTGLTKESLLLGSAAWLLALVLPWLYGGEKPRPTTVVAALLLALMQFKMRFFFAGLLFGAMTGLVVIRLAEHLGVVRRWVQVLLLAAVLAGGSLVAGELSPAFRSNKFTSQLVQSYTKLRTDSRHVPHVEYADLRPTMPSILSNTPAAIVNTLMRPWVGESKQPLYLLAGLENTVLLLILTLAVVAAGQGYGGNLPFALGLVLVVYALGLAALIGLSTPNLGTLNRYRSVLLPFVLLLALQNDYAAQLLRRLGL